jgi:hypothetical protein
MGGWERSQNWPEIAGAVAARLKLSRAPQRSRQSLTSPAHQGPGDLKVCTAASVGIKQSCAGCVAHGAPLNKLWFLPRPCIISKGVLSLKGGLGHRQSPTLRCM